MRDSGPPPPVLPPGAFFDGVLVLRDPARIDGRVRGEILAASDVWVGPDGLVEADLEGGTIVIEGQVWGDVRARSLIELRGTGRVRGRLTAPRLRVAEGCVIDGPCQAGSAAEEAPKGDPSAASPSSGRSLAQGAAEGPASA